MTDVGAIHWQEVHRCFKDATAWVKVVAKAAPDDKEDLVDKQMMWIEEFGKAVVSRKCGRHISSAN